MSSRLAAAVVSFTAVLGGCAGLATSHGDGGVCTSNNQCAHGSTCNPTTHTCVPSMGANSSLVLVGSPLGGQPTPTATTTTFPSVDPSAPLTLVLNAPRTIYGGIAGPDPAMPGNTIPIAATVHFVHENSTPAEGAVDANATTHAQMAADGTPYFYTASLVPGTYDITVTPSDLATYPPYYLPPYTIPDAGSAPVNLDVTYAASHTVVSGRIVDNVTQMGMPGVPVQIVDLDHGNRTISTVRTTDDNAPGTQAGNFSLWLSPGASDNWALEMVSTPTAAIAPRVATGRLVYRVDRQQLGASSMYSGLSLRAPSTISDTGSVSGSCSACVIVTASVEFDDPSAQTHMPIADATIALHADDVLSMLPPGHHAWFEAQAVSGRDGTFSAELMPGTYSAIITPPVASGLAVTQGTLVVTGNQMGQVLQVRRSIPVHAFVRSMTMGGDSSGMAGVVVEALPIDPTHSSDPLAMSAVAPYARESETATLDDGSFTLLLDEGEYLLVARPPPRSAFATQVFQPIDVTWTSGVNDSTPSAVGTSDLYLASPVTVMGSLFDSAQPTMQPVAQGVVRAFVQYTPAGGSPIDVEIARASTGSDGGFSLLLPGMLVQ